ncbi:MAG: LysR family transcriptional regulator [Pseudomonadales bacterium]|nr:LysR family transcriptional regulator [Pseudomonadales bacterium]
MDKLRAITVFRRVVELGSFKAAAEDLQLSKAAISKNINELEAFLQSPLIHRTTRKLSVTDDGQAYYHQVRQILDDLSNADLALRESADSLNGCLRISAPMSFGLTIINSAICEFMQRYPAIKVELVLNDQYTDLVAGGFDLAIRGAATLKDSSLKQRKLLTLKRVLCASPDYLANSDKLETLEDLQQHNCMIYSLSSSVTQWTCHKENEEKTFAITPGSYRVNNGLALIQAAVAGLGVILTPALLAQPALKSKQLLPLLPQWEFESHALYVIYPYHRETSRKLHTLIDFLVEYLAKESANPF